MKALADRWRAGTTGPIGIVENALRHFRREAFVYTLTPPALGSNPTDAFLFETRAGFCEHYASAFTLLMRIAGIPSRVVTGYLGGEYNELGDYLIVHQADAHAWSEVWIEGRGWTRIDPTAAVAPERVRRRIEFVDGRVGAPVRFLGDDLRFIGDLGRRLRLSLDTLNTRWEMWVLGYNSRRQSDILSLLGLKSAQPWSVGALMVGASALVVLLLASFTFDRRRYPEDPVTRLYRKFCDRLAAVGLERAPYEGAQDFAARAGAARPDLKPDIERISSLYCRLRYGRRSDPGLADELRALVRGFRPRRRRLGPQRLGARSPHAAVPTTPER
jgi:hypothetical protein